jgi:hypothetical protein
MVHATPNQLDNAYKEHARAGQGAEKFHRLLKFYAVECGLKAYFLRSKNLKDTEQLIKSGYSKDGHDIINLMKECHIPNLGITSPIERFGEKTFPLKDLHQYLRYHVGIPKSVIEDQVVFLDKIIEVLKNI